jgi:hypothetical protein
MILNVLMTVLMSGIRTVSFHSVTPHKFRGTMSSNSNRAARWEAHTGYAKVAYERK